MRVKMTATHDLKLNKDIQNTRKYDSEIQNLYGLKNKSLLVKGIFYKTKATQIQIYNYYVLFL